MLLQKSPVIMPAISGHHYYPCSCLAQRLWLATSGNFFPRTNKTTTAKSAFHSLERFSRRTQAQRPFQEKGKHQNPISFYRMSLSDPEMIGADHDHMEFDNNANWPRRLLHVPTMTSYKWAPGNNYGRWKEPAYI